MTFNQTNLNAGDVNNAGAVDPMVSILAGFLAGCLAKHGLSAMKVADAAMIPPGRFVVTFASGLVLQVAVTEVKP